MLARLVFYLIAAPVTVILCFTVPVLYVASMLRCPLGFLYRYLFQPLSSTPPPLGREHQHAGM